jgi:hypothetical protein
MAETEPTAIDKTLAKNKKGDHTELKSIKTSKKSLTITLKITILGADANNNVTLVVAPS